MTIQELKIVSDKCAADTSNPRRMMGGRYAQRAVRFLEQGRMDEARKEIIDSVLHWPDEFSAALPLFN